MRTWPLLLIVLLLPAIALSQTTNSTATNSTNPLQVLNNIDNIIENGLNYINDFLNNLSYITRIYVIKFSETLAIMMGIIGAFLYFTRLSRYTGRSLIIGAILLYLFAEVLKALPKP